MSESDAGARSRWSGARGVVAIITGAAVFAGCLVLLLVAFRGGDNTPSENLDELQPELSAFVPAAFDETFDGTGCPGS
jgi:hypothetical protein